MRRLTARQRGVVSYVALGHSYKYVAYELGISITAVATDLRDAMRKLGIRSRAELISTFGGSSRPWTGARTRDDDSSSPTRVRRLRPR